MPCTPDAEEYTTEYYTQWCRTHEDFLAAHVPSGYPRAVAYLAPHQGDRILDIGCGRGEIVNRCAEEGAYAVGLDYSQAAVEIAKQGGNSSVMRADATGLPFPADTFDKILFMEILEHLDDTDLERALHEMKRVLKPGGYIVGSTPNAWGVILVALARLAGLAGIKVTTATRHDPFHINVKNPLSVWQLFKHNGFKITLYLGQDYRLYPFEVPWWKLIASKLLFFALHIWWIAQK